MNKIVTEFLFIVYGCFMKNISATPISERDLRNLPPIFIIDPYDNCSQYCKYTIKLQPLGLQNYSIHWKTIEETIKHPEYYNHDELHYAICMDHYNVTPKTSPRELTSDLYNEKFKSLGLSVNISHYDCNKYDDLPQVQKFDLFFTLAFVNYLLFVMYATLVYKHSNKFITIFSITKNWNEFRTGYNKFGNLKCIEGIRFYTMVGVIVTHVYMIFARGYTENPSYLEEITQNPIRHWIRTLMVLGVQVYFLISAWLLSYQAFRYWDENGKIDLKFVLLSLVNRYFRLFPAVLLITGVGSSVWYFRFIKGPVKDLMTDPQYYTCKKNWWMNLLFISNQFNMTETCFPIFWYLAADMQLYALSLIILATICFLKTSVEKALLSLITVSLFVCSLRSYLFDLDTTFRLTQKNILLDNFEFSMIYSSTHSNAATYISGLLLGYIYYKHQNKNILKSQITHYLWWFLVAALPFMTVTLAMKKYNTPLRVLLAGVFKPMCCLGLGLGILGMSQSSNEVFEIIFANPLVVFLGNISFSTYLCHLLFVGYRVATTQKTLVISDYILGIAALKDTILSFFVGLLIHLLVELPAIKLQKLVIPQIHMKSKRKVI